MRKHLAAALLALLTPLTHAADSVRPCNLDQYRAHLDQLQILVASCKANIAACKPDDVGLDDQVGLNNQTRRVSYAWLRSTLTKAADTASKADQKKQAAAQLYSAVQRLKDDAATASALSSNPATQGELSQSAVAHAQPVLKSVLATSEFHNTTQPSLWDRAIQRILEWLDDKLRSLGSAPGLSRRTVLLIVYASILVCLTLLVWWYVRQVRQQRIALASSSRIPHPTAASAVDWQQWLEQAQALAAAGDWREAVHLVYWAAISRLESSGNWPADRARTPREYLQLLPAAHRKRSDLTLLTRSFERIWYGHGNAREADFESARTLLERLAE